MVLLRAVHLKVVWEPKWFFYGIVVKTPVSKLYFLRVKFQKAVLIHLSDVMPHHGPLMTHIPVTGQCSDQFTDLIRSHHYHLDGSLIVANR